MMKQNPKTETSHAAKATGFMRSRPSSYAASSENHLAQLAAMANGSAHVQTSAQLKEDIQRSDAIQGLFGLASEINQVTPAQLFNDTVNSETGEGLKADSVTPGAEGISDFSFDHEKIHRTPAQRKSAAPVQRVRILLKDVDRVLMGRLRLVPVANAGAQTLQDPAQVNTLIQIGNNESIVLEGHGHHDDPLFGTPKIVSQGGIAPADLARLVRDVPKSGAWAGDVVLLGCSTGSITAAVSQEYFKLTGNTVRVIGTRANIRVGTKEDGSNFIGHDWKNQPLDQRPADLAFVEDLIQANKEFIAAAQQLIADCKALDQNVKGIPTPVPHPITQVEARGLSILDVESLSDHRATALPGRRYAKPARIRMAALFREVFDNILKVTFFSSPSTINPIASVPTARGQVDDVLDSALTLSEEGMQLYTEVDYELHGYMLKEIDLTSNVSAQHSKRRRTATSIFGDTWVDEP